MPGAAFQMSYFGILIPPLQISRQRSRYFYLSLILQSHTLTASPREIYFLKWVIEYNNAHSIFSNFWSTSDINIPLIKLKTWSTPDFN